MKEKLVVIGLLLAFVGSFFGGFKYLEARFASAAEQKQTKEMVQKISDRLDYKMVLDHQNALQERIWKIVDREGRNPTNRSVQEELRKLEADKVKAEKKLEILQEKVGGME